MLRSILNRRHLLLVAVILLVVSVQVATAQTTEFAYEGFLNDNGEPADGNYDFEFRLFDTGSGGSQQGATVQRLNVAVNNGVFKVILDFGAAVFTGEDRFLEIGSRPAGSFDPLTVLLPRPQITSEPHAIRSLNATSADNATNATNAVNAANATNATNAAQLGGISASQYVLTTDPRMTDARNPLPNSANYIQNRTTQQASTNFNISGSGTAGGALSANAINATTQFNVGGNRILSNAGTANLFAGVGAGNSTTGINNSFFGKNAGNSHTTGNGNAFFGNSAGLNNTTSSANSFFGNNAGSGNTTGDLNTFIGNAAGNTNTNGHHNTLIGANTSLSMHGLSYATAIGAGAVAWANDLIMLGRLGGQDRVEVPGILILRKLYSAGHIDLCLNTADYVSTCSSSLRYKTAVQPFTDGLNLVNRLRPITFSWKDGGMRDVGFAAEEVERVEPLLITRNDQGEIEGVKYGQITTVLVNAIQQQQAQISEQRRTIEQQQTLLQQQKSVVEILKQLVCQNQRDAEVCKP